jgi:hypothetical protein
MPESTAKIRLTLDGQQFNQATDRMKKGAEGVGTTMGKWGEQALKATVGIGIIVGGLKRAIEAANEFKKSMGEANKDAGNTALRLNEVARALKLNNNQRGIRQSTPLEDSIAGGTRTREEGLSFLESLKEKGGANLGDEKVRAALDAYMSGTYTADEARKQARRGGFDPEGRKAGMSDPLRAELDRRAAEKRASEGTQGTLNSGAAGTERDISTLVKEVNARAGAYGATAGANVATTPDFMLRQEARYALGDRDIMADFASNSGRSQVQQILQDILGEMRTGNRKPVTGARGETP